MVDVRGMVSPHRILRPGFPLMFSWIPLDVIESATCSPERFLDDLPC